MDYRQYRLALSFVSIDQVRRVGNKNEVMIINIIRKCDN